MFRNTRIDSLMDTLVIVGAFGLLLTLAVATFAPLS